MTRDIITRAFELDDITVSRSGTGRTVTAYAAVFDKTAQVRDFQGVYNETYVRSAFNKTLADRGLNRGVLYNHGMTATGSPSEMFSIPLGACRSIQADGTGVLTVSEYSKGDLQDQILEGIQNGAIRSQSFSGPIIAYNPGVPRGGFRPNQSGALTLVTRTEMGLNEYGPAAISGVFADAAILSVRSLVEHMHGLSTQEKDEMFELLRSATPTEPAEPPTPLAGPSVDEPPDGHSGRSTLTPDQRRTLIRARILARSTA
jgi:phage head maturation protease